MAKFECKRPGCPRPWMKSHPNVIRFHIFEYHAAEFRNYLGGGLTITEPSPIRSDYKLRLKHK